VIEGGGEGAMWGRKGRKKGGGEDLWEGGVEHRKLGRKRSCIRERNEGARLGERE